MRLVGLMCQQEKLNLAGGGDLHCCTAMMLNAVGPCCAPS